jgi:hypothetical protein
MQKIFVFICLVSTIAYSQTNTFPGSGNVGVGTTTPQSKLHVVDGSGGDQIKISRGTGSVRFIQDNNVDDLYLMNSDASKTLMFWGQSGNVGIGTYQPDYKLHIVDGSGGAQLKFQRGTGIATIVQDNNVDDLYISATSGLFLNPTGGNVGIGTYQPDYKLHIKDGVGGAQLKFQRGTGIATVDQDNNVNDLYISAPAGLFLNYNGGNVGIGTYQPDYKLHIKDGIGGAQLKFQRGTGVATMFQDNNVNDLYVSATAGLFLNPDGGNVGIGTTTPGSFKLAVNGKIWSQEVNVAMTNPGPDYVFEKNYSLLPLAQLEAYINQNKHLPEVPSAKEMEENGLNVKEMNLILLKKVEELTLHLIEKEKRMSEMEDRIEVLERSRK